MRQSIKACVVIAVKGFCMGAADVVPGVSGGTMAFILGIYTRFIDAIKSFDAAWMKACLKFDFNTAIKRPDFPFILPLVIGIFSAVLFFTRVVPLPRLLVTNPEHVYGLFFGLITGSIAVLLIELGRLRISDLVEMMLGFGIGILIVTAVPTVTPDSWWFIMLVGALAICAMVVPGISGSFVLLLLGKYAYVLDAVGHLRMAVIIPFAVGAAAGLFTFTRVLSWLLHRYERAALLGIAGFLVASLWVIWPFQQRRYVEIRGSSKLMESAAQMPELSAGTFMVLALATVGFAAVVALHRMASVRSDSNRR